MTSSEIEAFFKIIKCGSISAAAENLFVTQPALTRRIQTLENELGYALFKRKKGQKNIELTEKGKAFISVAQRLQDLWQEAMDIGETDHSDLLKISAIDSVSSYILPEVFRSLSDEPENIRICFRHCHSFEAYDYVANGIADIALISDPRYYPNLQTVPLFQEPMILLVNSSSSCPDTVSPKALDPRNEIFLPWNPEFHAWHDYWFGSAAQYHAFMDQMSLLEYFLSWKNTWAIAPFSVADTASRLPYVSVRKLDFAPSPRLIYYVKKANREIKFEQTFLHILLDKLSSIPEFTIIP